LSASPATTRAADVRLLVLDVDGVLTDGSLYLGNQGEEFKAFHVRDGHGIKMLQETGIQVAIITGRSSPLVADRMRSLGVEHVYQGQEEKLPAFTQLLEALKLKPEQVACVGVDVLDLPLLLRAGLAVSVADGHPLVARHSHWCTPSPGGRGAVREVCEFIMEAQGTLDALHRSYLT